MKFVTLASLLLGLTFSANAADRQAVDFNVFNLVRNNLKLEEFRVYSSKKIKINRKASSTQSDRIGAGIDRESIRKIQEEKLGDNVRGKIIATQNADQYSEDFLLFVSFDKTCTQKSCSYVFKYMDEKFKLLAVPTYQMDEVKVRSKKAVFYTTWNLQYGISYGLRDHTVLSADSRNYKHRPVLEYKLSESDTTVRDEVRNRGW